MPAVIRRSPLHDGAVQTVWAAKRAQPPMPSQAPVVPQVAGAWTAQTSCGSGLPMSIGPAGSAAALLVAADARTLAGDVAADPVGAERRLALVGLGAHGAVRFQAAAAVHAQDAAGAVGVGLARRRAPVRRGVAVERRADRRRAGPAASLAVADVDVADGGAVTGARLAHGALRVLAAVPLAVARAVEPAGRDGADRAGARLFRHAVRDERADPGGALAIAGLARLRARAVAADAVDAEAALAVAVAPAGLAVRLAARRRRSAAQAPSIPPSDRDGPPLSPPQPPPQPVAVSSSTSSAAPRQTEEPPHPANLPGPTDQ